MEGDDYLLALSRYVHLNPVKVLEPGKGAVVVDSRMRVRSVPQRWLPSRKDIPAAERRLR